jgi:hypothetical protein
MSTGTKSGGDWLESRHEKLAEQSRKTKTYLDVIENRMKCGLGTGPEPPFGRDVKDEKSNEQSTNPPAVKPYSEIITPLGEWYDNDFIPSYAKFHSAVDAWKPEETRTQVMMAAVVDARKEFEPKYRSLHKIIKDNPLITNEDLAKMGFPWGANVKTQKPVTQNVPKIKIQHPSDGVVAIYFSGEHNPKGGKEPDTHGAELVWAVLDHIPATMGELIHSTFDTNSPLRLTFDISDKGKTVYFAARWENNRGEKGPWTAVFSAVIS